MLSPKGENQLPASILSSRGTSCLYEFMKWPKEKATAQKPFVWMLGFMTPVRGQRTAHHFLAYTIKFPGGDEPQSWRKQADMTRHSISTNGNYAQASHTISDVCQNPEVTESG